MSGYNKKIAGGGFHHLAMKVENFDEVVAFYVQGLGFTQAKAWGEGNSRAVMLDTGDGNYMEIFAGGKNSTCEGAFLHVAFRTDDCDLAIEKARQAGGKVTIEPKEVVIESNPKTPARIAFCVGLANETIEFFQTHENQG